MIRTSGLTNGLDPIPFQLRNSSGALSPGPRVPGPGYQVIRIRALSILHRAYHMCGFGSVLGVRPSERIQYPVPDSRYPMPGTRYLPSKNPHIGYASCLPYPSLVTRYSSLLPLATSVPIRGRVGVHPESRELPEGPHVPPTRPESAKNCSCPRGRGSKKVQESAGTE